MLKDILEALKSWPTWKRMTDAPDRIDQLEKRIAELEANPAKAPGQPCPSCGALAFRVVASRKSTGPFRELGKLARDYRCAECSFKETRDPDD